MVAGCFGGVGSLLCLVRGSPCTSSPASQPLVGDWLLVRGGRACLPRCLSCFSRAPRRGDGSVGSHDPPTHLGIRYFIDTSQGGLLRVLEGSSLALNLVARSG